MFNFLKNIIISCMPTMSYFLSTNIYNMFQIKKKEPKKEDILQCRYGMLSIIPANIFIISTLFENGENDKEEEIRIYNLLLGVISIDTVQYFLHLLFHIPLLYNNFHKEHHRVGLINPLTALTNSIVDEIFNSIIIVLSLFYLGLNYYEYIIVTSLAICATVSDHTYVDGNSFHYIHHHVDKNSNFQQPFFTYWDHIFGTIHPNSKRKIPFIP